MRLTQTLDSLQGVVGASLEDGNLHADSDRRLQIVWRAIWREERAHLHAHASLLRGAGINLSVVSQGVIWLYFVPNPRGRVDVRQFASATRNDRLARLSRDSRLVVGAHLWGFPSTSR